MGEELLRVKVCGIGGKIDLENPKLYGLVVRFFICKRRNANFVEACVSKSIPENFRNRFDSTFEAHAEENFTFLFFFFLIRHFLGSNIPTKMTEVFLRKKVLQLSEWKLLGGMGTICSM